MPYKPSIVSERDCFKLIDSEDKQLLEPKIQRRLKRYRSLFCDYHKLKIPKDINYTSLNELTETLDCLLPNGLELAPEIQIFIEQNRYAIQEHQMAGITIKDYDSRWNSDVLKFSQILNQEITRPLKPQQLQAAFYFVKMKRAANFSVPGAGKTAMTYGAFAYLSSPLVNLVDKLLVVSPINAFEAWEKEYTEVFGSKRRLEFFNLKSESDMGKLRARWGKTDVAVINYESLSGTYVSVLNELIDEKTMLVFDEVHRIKNPIGKRAKKALELGNRASYRYVLTGTPIPNSYQDIYNFLNILYKNEYQDYFGWDFTELNFVSKDAVNEKLQPFFWRTTKTDLQVPPAENDILEKIEPTVEQQLLAEVIHRMETNPLALYIRLMQASSNPALLTERLELADLELMDFEKVGFDFDSAFNDFERELAKQQEYIALDVANMRSSKFDYGIELIKRLVSEGKKVIVWGLFVGTMNKIHRRLSNIGINTQLIYGQTPKELRPQMLEEFRYGACQVLISNPATLGEAVSLHQTVHDAVYFEYNFNLTFMLQSRDRIHRLGLADDQYTRYHYLMTVGDPKVLGYVDQRIYNRLKEKETIMLSAIEGEYLVPEVTDDYLEDIKRIVK